jgi:hypothetical protein
VNADDHAVVIGIRRYWDAALDGSSWVTNLNGPDNDADAVAEWLRQPDGGGLPAANINAVRSADLPDPFTNEDSAGPHQRAVEQAFDEVAELNRTAFEGRYAGRRLYVYVSGHGYARQRDEAALVTAEAKRARPLNVLITSWMDWLWDAGRFKEYVLWVDTCATRVPLTFLKPCDRDPDHSLNAAEGRQFTAFAAGFDKRAVENQMSDGRWHGVFTYALLQGLKGAANTPITTSSLRDYLLNNMSAFMREDQRRNNAVAKEPAFARADELDFGQPVQRPTFGVTLRFPQEWVGKQITISTSSTNPPIAQTVLQQAEWTGQLEVGVYVLLAPEVSHYQAFGVSGRRGLVVTIP